MVSDVDAKLAEAAASQQEQQNTASRDASGLQSAGQSPEGVSQGREEVGRLPAAAQAPAPSKVGSVGGWLVAVLAIILIIVFAKLHEEQNAKPTATEYAAAPSEPAPAYTPTAPSPMVTAPAPSPAPVPQVPTRPTEVKPSVGSNNILSLAEIRYCTAEKIRLDTGGRVTDRYSQAAINTFNAAVMDFNSRCGSFRYHGDDVVTAKAEVEQFRGEIEIEGMVKFRTATPESAPSASQQNNVYGQLYGGSQYGATTPSSPFGNSSPRVPRYNEVDSDEEEGEKEE